ncbi:PREDICTED: uncharacterized protein LOC108562908 [Nicrophorus vespilloides]|uniref:Uncharacterized protein LOC108562908 n=1 Tax=Nicrophorus vespilloides TaxID=110193 RepID=A0ABM1MQQ2_NICVS|nr:PREDICTED: uncharacterized protein LOC108562908 [Nicrophorus vespilloides]
MNPMHTVPTIDDNGFYLWESRAIMQYLVDQYGKDDSLSPTVPKLAAIVNQQLYFDACTLNARLYEYMLPIMMRSAKPNMEVHAKVEEALGVFDTILSKNKWAAGDNLTIADFALMSTVSTLEAIMFDIKKYPNVENWLNSCKRDVTHFEETIQKGSDWIHDYLNEILRKITQYHRTKQEVILGNCIETDTVVPIFTKTTKIGGKMNPVDVYFFPASPPSRAVILLAKFLGLIINAKVTNIMAGEQMTPEFLKMNPMHTVPVIDDNGFHLFESRAIMQYLVDQYATDDSLAPKEPKLAARVNERLYFDSGTLSSQMQAYMFPVFKGGQPNNEAHDKILNALQVFDKMLENNTWAAGDKLTIADFSLVATISTLEAIKFDITIYPNVHRWYEACKKEMTDYEESNQKGATMLGGFYASKLKN